MDIGKFDSKSRSLAPYFAPKVKVVEIGIHGVLCQSGQSFGFGSGGDTVGNGDTENPWQ